MKFPKLSKVPTLLPETYKSAHLIFPAARALGCGPIGHAVAGPGVKTKQLSADAVVFEARGGAAILAALRVQAEQLAGQNARQTLLLVGRVVHAGGRLPAENGNIRVVVEKWQHPRGCIKIATSAWL